MCWNETLILMLRAVINDLDSTPDFTDERLEQMIVVAAKFVNQDLNTTYAVNISSPSISPDPVVNNDDVFNNLTVIKAACLIDQGSFRQRAILEGLEAKCGPATLKTLGSTAGFSELIKFGPCGAYQKMLTDYKLGDASICHAILSPFISNTYNPSHTDISESHRYN